MIPDFMVVLGPILERLQALAASDADFRDQLRDLGKVLIALAQESRPCEPASPAPSPSPPEPAPSLEPSTAPVELPAAEPVQQVSESSPILLREQPTGCAAYVQPFPPTAWQEVTDDDLPLLEARCRLKAEGARWAATRQRRIREGAAFAAEIAPHDRAIIARARALPDCFLWMCHRDGPSPADLSLYDDLAGCFDAAAEAVALLRSCTENLEDHLEMLAPALDLAAEAQSALRVAVAAMGGRPDGDQLKLFHWLRATGAEQQILIRRFMRGDDLADPASWADLQERLGQCAAELRLLTERARRRRKLHSKIRYHLKQIHANSNLDCTSDWRRVVEVVEELVQDGVPPSNRDLRDLLLPVLDDLPETVAVTRNFELVLREIDRFLSSRSPEPDAAVATVPSDEVRRAADLLRGRAVVLIGGEGRPHAAEALTAALGLSELIWVEGWRQSYTTFEPHIARPDVAVVILAIRWSPHGFGEVKVLCDKYGKPLVRLPAGYSPNQVAYHVVSQVGERLGGVGCRAAC